MLNYVSSFIFYTLAMIGIMLIAFVVYKKTFQPNGVEHKGIIKVIDSLAIGNKKHLLIVKIKNENFLIASGLEHTTFLAKLDSNLQPKTTQNEIIEAKEIEETNESLLNQIMTPPKAPINEIQKHFQELYEKKETTNYNTQAHRKEMINKLLKEINSDSKA